MLIFLAFGYEAKSGRCVNYSLYSVRVVKKEHLTASCDGKRCREGISSPQQTEVCGGASGIVF